MKEGKVKQRINVVGRFATSSKKGEEVVAMELTESEDFSGVIDAVVEEELSDTTMEDMLKQNTIPDPALIASNAVDNDQKRTLARSEPDPLLEITGRLEKIEIVLETLASIEKSRDTKTFSNVPEGGSLGGKRSKKTKTKEHNKFLEYIREHLQTQLGFSPNDKIENWRKPKDNKLVQKVNEGELPWQLPTDTNLAMDWENKKATVWMNETLELLVESFMKEYDLNAYPGMGPRPEGSVIFDAMHKHCIYQKKRYALDQEKAEEALKVARRTARMRQLYSRRLELCDHHGLPDEGRATLELLGVDGMSSEESLGQPGGNQRRYHIRPLIWRRPELTRWLHNLDRLPTTNAVGHVLAHRVYRRTREPGGSTSSIKRRIPSSLPKNFFSPDWLSTLGDRGSQRLNIVEKPHVVPVLPDFKWEAK